mmetsp:Transcript_20998/g.45770  ORF Transcript_20998/g.45770 Transcript_20998/m.45770 type:complete len:97 (+) Transcript_20998:745-1035(+)
MVQYGRVGYASNTKGHEHGDLPGMEPARIEIKFQGPRGSVREFGVDDAVGRADTANDGSNKIRPYNTRTAMVANQSRPKRVRTIATLACLLLTSLV